MLEAMHASSVRAPVLTASRSISTWTCGLIVAQLMNNFPRAFTSKLSAGSAKIFRIAASSLTTVMIASDSAVTSESDAIITVVSDDAAMRSEEHTSELQSRGHLVCRFLLGK